jgi:hypothetical protein
MSRGEPIKRDESRRAARAVLRARSNAPVWWRASADQRKSSKSPGYPFRHLKQMVSVLKKLFPEMPALSKEAWFRPRVGQQRVRAARSVLSRISCRRMSGAASSRPSRPRELPSRSGESHPGPLTGRVGDWRAGLGRSLCSPLTRSFVCECHNISTMPRFQPPPRRTQRANFWHYAPLLASPQSL